MSTVGKVDSMLAQEIAGIANQLEHDWFTNNKWYKTRTKKVKRVRKIVSDQILESAMPTGRLIQWQ